MTMRMHGWVSALAAALLVGSAARAETLEEVKKQLGEKFAGHKTVQYKVKMQSDQSVMGMSMKSTVDAIGAMARKGDKVLSRVEQESVSIRKMGDEEQKTESKSLTISDGEYTYTLMENTGQQQAVKQKIDPETQASMFDPAKMLEQFEEAYLLKLLPAESVNGKPAHVIEMTPKDENMREYMGRSVLYFDQESGLGVKTLTYNNDGKVTGTTEMTDIKINADVSPDMFVFKAPPGVEVVEQTNIDQ